MKRFYALCIALVLCGSTVWAEQDNLEYQSWKQFKAGSWVKLKSVTEASGMATESEITTTLIEVTAEKAVLEMQISMTIAGNKMDQPAMSRDVLAKIEESEQQASSEPDVSAETESGKETIDVAGKSVSCSWNKTTTETGGNTIIAKSWTSEEVPGGMVKMESTMEGAFSSKTAMTLVEWESK